MQTNQMIPFALTCEYRVNPIGIEAKNPAFAWKLSGSQRGLQQSAYQIIVSDETAEGNLYWDSGKVISDCSVSVYYAGKPLTSRKHLFWKVRVWDVADHCSDWSEPAFFEMGLLEPQDWKAKWIAAPDETTGMQFRKEWRTEKPVKRARAYISGMGWYELFINGQKCGNRVLTPDRSDFTKRAYYHVYDVTEQLREGANVAGVWLGNGWYNQKDKVNEKLVWYGYPKLLLQLEICYQDGTEETIVSDDSFRYTTGAMTYNNVYFGERYDARLEKVGWDLPDYDDSDWKFALLTDGPGGRLTEQKSYSDTVCRELKPVKISQPTPGMYVVDFGQNITGWARLQVRGKAGDVVTMRFGEELWPDGKVNYYSTGSNWKQQKDIYILSGRGKETYEPRFTWHGFRYAEVQGYPGELSFEDITGVFVHSGVPETGSFSCSNALLNQLQKACQWTMLGGMHCGIPLDSPHRERQGYGGDALIIAEACMYNFDMERFYSAWMDDFADAQKENGFLPHTVPCQDGGGGPGWGSAYIIISWLCYRHYGDVRILKDHFENMNRWMEFLATGVENGIVEGEGNDRECLGEWSTPGEILIPPRFVNTYIYAYSAQLMAKIAAVLRKEPEQKHYESLERETVDAFNREFLNPVTGQYSIGAQGTEAFAYQLGAVPEDMYQKTADFLAAHIKEDCENHLDTGIFGTLYLMKTLVETKNEEIAYDVITGATYPSYGYMLANGATTLWEYWEKEYGFYQVASCHNQPMFGSISGWMYEKIGGIAPAAPAYKEILIAPKPMGELRFADSKVETMYGTISVDWENTADLFELYVNIPCNTTAKIILPAIGAVYEKGNFLWDRGTAAAIDGVISVQEAADGIMVEVGSGDYRFRLEKRRSA